MDEKFINIFTDRLVKSDIVKFIDKFDTFTDKGKEYILHARLAGKNKVKFSVDSDGSVFLIPVDRFKLLINDNVDLNKMLVAGMESIHNKTKPDRFYMALFRFFINIAKYVDNNNEAYTIPFVQKSYMKNDFRKIMTKLDGYYKTKEYKEIINRGNIKYVY